MTLPTIILPTKKTSRLLRKHQTVMHMHRWIKDGVLSPWDGASRWVAQYKIRDHELSFWPPRNSAGRRLPAVT